MKRFKHWTGWSRGVLPGLCCAGGLLVSLTAEDDSMRWRWSSPQPHGNNIVAMAWSPAAGYAAQVTERGGLYTSVDLERWTLRISGTREALRSVGFLGSRLIVTGASGTVLYADGSLGMERGELLDGPTADWLEAMTVSEDLVVAVGDNGAVYTSEDGMVWRRVESGVADWLRGVAHGNGTFVAVGEDGTIIVSEDGEQWERVESHTSVDINRVAFVDGTFIAVGDDGWVSMSTSGLDWESQSIGATGNLYDVAPSPNGWLVLGDGECWVHEENAWFDQLAESSSGLPSWTYYTAISGSNWILVAGQTGLIVEGRRTGPGKYDWTVLGASPRHWLFDVMWAGELFVAVGDRANVLTSSTGVDWVIESVPESLTSSIFLGVGGTTNLLVAAGSQGSLMISPQSWVDLVLTNSSGTVVTQSVNTLGIVWHAIEPRPTSNDLQGVTYHDGHYYVVGDGGLVLRSEDGTNWTQRIAPTIQFLSGITGFDGGLVASGDAGALVYSADGEDWVALESGTTNWLYRVRNLNGQLLAVGQNGVLLGSVNGLDWSPRSSGTDRWLSDVTLIDDRYFAVGTGGTVLSSGNAVNWDDIGTVTGKALSGLANDGQRLVMVGVEGVILRATVVPDLTPIQILGYSRFHEEGADTVQNLFLFGGRVDQRFTLERRPGLGEGQWTVGPVLEFLDHSGTLQYLESVGAGTAPTMEFYRGTLLP
jgi:hypothetical protein